jgi:hypothetical protein
MGRTCKTFAIILTIIIAMSCLTLLLVKPASAQTNPSVPQFSLKYLNQTVEIRIINQPFTSNSVNGRSVGLYYDIRWKEHNEAEWHYFFPHSYLFEATNSVDYDVTDSSLTVVSYGLNSKDSDVQLNGDFAGKQLDFEVQALIGSYTVITTQPNEKYHYPFDGEISGYSNTQTIAIPQDSSNTTTPMPSPSPTVPELSWWVILPLFVSLIFISVIIRHRKNTTASENL